MKLQLMLAARGGREEPLVQRLETEAEHCKSRLENGSQVAVLMRPAKDLFARFHPGMRAFDAILELVAPGEQAESLCAAVEGIAGRLSEDIHSDLSGAFVGSVNSVVPPRPTPLRFVYLMRRKAGMSHAEYIDYYQRIHADFGRRTPAIAGYEQLHIQEKESRAAADAAGVGIWRADSVSELSIPALDPFLKALATSPVREEGPADELNFVDRTNCVGFLTEVRARFVL